MDEKFYEMIYKRKSFHIFKDTESISKEEIESIESDFKIFKPLIKDIKVDAKIVPQEQTTCKRGAEYCILLYSEKKENYLQNIGYIGEQLDLYLASKNIGALWFGIGKIEEPQYNGLDFVIMIAISKMPKEKFRKDMFKSKRKLIEEIWQGESYLDIANIVRFAPSACNTQPWLIESNEKELKIYRYKKPGKRGIMPVDKVVYYNKIDMGIFLLFLDLCLKHHKLNFQRKIFLDEKTGEDEIIINAIYDIDK